jgi:hypothetical protein
MKYALICVLAGLAALFASPATAQLPSGNGAPTTLGRTMDDAILVDGSPAEAAAHQTLTPGGQLWQQGRQQTQIKRQDWLAAGRPEVEFDRIHGINRQMCVRSAVRILRYEDLAKTYEALTGLGNPLTQRLIGMGGKIRTAAGVRQGAGVVQSGLGILTGLLTAPTGAGLAYGGAVTAGAIGNEAQGQVHDESMLLNRDQSLYIHVATLANLEANLLSAEGNIDYWEWIQNGYCYKELARMTASAQLSSPQAPLQQGPQPRIPTRPHHAQ